MESEAEVRQFWFGALDASGRATKEHTQKWFTKDPSFDRSVFEHFGGLHSVLLSGGHRSWRRQAKSLVAYVLVLDQFSRNMFRGTAGMFAGDELALSASFEGIALGFDRELAFDERSFLYMPLQHSERIEVQERSVELFRAMAEDGDAARTGVSYAERHRDIVRRFGRFPHRNAVLGRESTPEEVAFLREPGSSF